MKKLFLLPVLLAAFNLFGQCPGLTPNITFTDPTCFSSFDGVISASPSGGSGNYSYELIDGASNSAGTNTTGTFFNLPADSYSFIIEDIGNSCFDTTIVTLTEPAPIVITTIITDDICNGSCAGIIDVQATGGTFVYQYSIDGGATFQGSNIFTNLCAGTYNVLVQDANGCVEQISATVQQPALITVSETITPDSGAGDGSITVTATGGSGGLTFDWTGPNGFTSTSQNISGLVAGTYVLTVTDGNGCTTIETMIVSSTALVTTHFTMDPMCFGNADGGVDVQVTGGSGNYEFEVFDLAWNPIYQSTTFFSFYGLPAGQWAYVVTDLTTSDADTNYFDLFDPMQIMAFETITHATCGQCNGSIMVNTTGGTPPYAYNWSNGSTTAWQNGLCPGVYTIDIVDANGCIVTMSYTITNTGASFSGSTTVTDATCGNCDGSILFSPSGGTAPYTYLWDDPIGQTTNPAVNLCAGIYSVTVTDNSGCSMVFMDTVGNGSNVAATVMTTTNTSCLACDGEVTVVATGGTPPYTYVNVTTQDTNTTGTFNGLCANVHYVEVIDAAGCSNVVTYIINQTGLTGLNYSSVVTDETATGASDGSIDISYDTTTYPNMSFSWSPISATTEDLLNLPSGTYTVTLLDSATGGCESYTETVNTLPSHGYVMGQVFSDNNGDCIFNTGDTYLSNVLITITDGTNTYTTITYGSGYYYMVLPNGNYTVTPTLSSPFTINCAGSQNVTIAGSNVTGVNFYASAPPFEDLCIYNSSGWGFVPGFATTISTTVINNGNMTSSGELSVILPAGIIYNYSNPVPTSISGDTLFYDVNNLVPGGSFVVYTSVTTPTWFQLGDVVENCANIALLGGGTDANPACNSYCSYTTVVGSYDPNDKAVQPMGIEEEGYIETDVEEFTYLIRFQNTGTAPAHNVYITDTLDAMLDPTTLQVLSESHNMTVEFPLPHVVKFRFDNIMLPDSNANEPESHGFVQFKINTANTPLLTETIENTANIYFDFNEPVITNTTLNTYADFSSVAEVANDEFFVYPNPAGDQIFVANIVNANYRIYDLQGKVLNVGQVMMNEPLDISSLTTGVYFIEIQTDQGVAKKMFTKQ
jgi:hypothetical protein